jgi:hypothetical protein
MELYEIYEIYDSHIHSEGRSQKELSEMSDSGIKTVNSCAFYPVKPRYPGTLIDLFRKLEEFETYRGEKAGLKVVPAFGIHPRCIPGNWQEVIDFLEESQPKIFGEIGLETAEEIEIEVLKVHLNLAKKLDIPCIIHTPRRNKNEITQKILDILDMLQFPEELAVIDHVGLETASEILSRGYHAGLTVEEGKLSERDVFEIITKFGPDKLMINSDTGFTSLDYLSTVRAITYLVENDVDAEIVKQLAFKNAKEFFRV